MKSKNTNNTSTLIIAFLTFAGLGLTAGLLGVAWPYIQSEFGLDLDAVTLVMVVQTITYTTASFFVGRLMARFGSGESLIVGILIMALSMFAVANASTWVLFVLFGMIGGFGSGTIDAGLNMYITAYHSARDMNWLHASFGAGIALGPLLMTYCVLNLSWHIGYLITGGVLLGIAALLFITRKQWHNGGFQSEENQPVKRASIGESLQRPVLWFSMLTFMVYVGMEIGIGQWAYTLLTQSRGVSEDLAGTWVSVYWGVFTGGRILFGFIANRFAPTRLLRWSLLATAVGAIFFAWNPLPIVGSIGLIIVGFAEAPVFAMLMSTTPERMGLEHAENGVTMQMVSVGIGGAIIPGLIGTIGKHYGLETMTMTFAAMAIATLVLHELAHISRHKQPTMRVVNP